MATWQTRANNTRLCRRRGQFGDLLQQTGVVELNGQSVSSSLLVLSLVYPLLCTPHHPPSLSSSSSSFVFPFSPSLVILSLMSAPSSPTIGQVAHEKGRVRRRDRPPALDIADPKAASDGDVRYVRDVANDSRKVPRSLLLHLDVHSLTSPSFPSPLSRSFLLKSSTLKSRRTSLAPPQPRLL